MIRKKLSPETHQDPTKPRKITKERAKKLLILANTINEIW